MILRRALQNCTLCLVAAAGLLSATPARAQSAGPADLHRAYFLEHQSKEYAAAKVLYRAVLTQNVSDELKHIARSGAGRCRDAIAAQEFSRLMPPDAVAYVELNRPGRFVEQLAGLIGLTTDDMRELLDRRPNQGSRQLAHVPNRIALSPAIFNALTAFGGAAAALTDFDPTGQRPPAGVLVLHHGDTNLIRGLIETAFQFAPLGEKIRDFPTFGATLPCAGKLTGVLTESLLIVGTGTELVTGVVERLIGERDDGLAARDDLADLAPQRKGATIFAYCDLQGVVQRVISDVPGSDRRELKLIDGLVDLASLRWAALSLGIQDDTLAVRFSLRLDDDHRCIAYNLMRLPPMTGQCLKMVPADAAAVFGMGLNPAFSMAAADAAQDRAPASAVSALDIFREFFGNVRELCAFVIPGDAGPKGIPNGCVVMAVNDVARSRALWDQFLSLPGMLDEKDPAMPRGVMIADTQAMSYRIPDFGNVYLAELDGCIILGATRNALKSAIRAKRDEKSITEDQKLGKAVATLPRDTSIFAAAHVGRCIRVGAGKADHPAAGIPATMAADLCANTVAWFGMGQAPSEFSLQIAVSGLPNVNDALEKFAPMINAFIPVAPVVQHSAEPVVQREGRVQQERHKETAQAERQ